MARKGKGAALYELLYRDKGKSTAANGSIKLPSWWGQPAGKTPPAAASPGPGPSRAEPKGDEQKPVAPAPTGPAAAAPAPVSATPPAAAPAGPQAEPKPNSAEPRRAAVPRPSTPKPAGAPAIAQPPTGRPPARATPPPAQPTGAWPGQPLGPPGGRWFDLSQGRVKLDISGLSALIAVVATVVVLLGVFVGGLNIGRGRAVSQPPAIALPANVQSEQDKARLPREASLPPVRPTPPPGASPDSVDESPAIPGRTYVATLAGGEKSRLYDAKKLLAEKGLDFVVGVQKGEQPLYYLRSVGSWEINWRNPGPEDKARQEEFSQFNEQVRQALAEVAKEHRGLIGKVETQTLTPRAR